MDRTFKALAAVGGSAAAYLYGGWTPLLQALVVIATLDIIFGWAAAIKAGRTDTGQALNSNVGYWGMAKKLLMFGIVAAAHVMDGVLGEAHLLRDAALSWYLANELLSIVENSGRIGLPVPPMIAQAVDVLRKRGAA